MKSLNGFVLALSLTGGCFATGYLASGSVMAATALPIKNGVAPANIGGNITHTCQAVSSTDDHLLKQINDQRLRALSTLSNAQKTSFFDALAASTVPGNLTSRRSSVTFDLEGTNKIGLNIEENTPDGGIRLRWGTCLNVRVFDGAGAFKQITFFSDPRTITQGDRCYQGAAGDDQLYLPLSVGVMEGFSVINREFGPTQIVSDSLTLGGSPFPIVPAPLPVDGNFLVPMTFVESIALEDAQQDLNGDGNPSNTMGFLFGDLLAAGSAALSNFSLEIVITGTLEADCQTLIEETNPLFIWEGLSGSGEQGIIDYDTEAAYLNWQ